MATSQISWKPLLILNKKVHVFSSAHQNKVMSTIKAGGGEVVIIPVAAVTVQSIEVVLGPLPSISKHVMVSKLIGRVHVDWL